MEENENFERGFLPLKNDLFLRAARGLKVEKVPVWIMRQAGRYLPEFRKVREEHDFFEICQTPSLAAEVTLQPIRRFSLDAAIIFSDILVIPQALGMKVEMVRGVGPTFPEPLNGISDLQRLPTHVDVRSDLDYVYEAITLTRKQLDGVCPLIGFCGAPWTLMSYMIEGSGSSSTKSKAKHWLYCNPRQSHQLLSLLAQVATDHLYHQVLAGAQALQVFESHAGVLGIRQFHEFVLPYLKQIAKDLRSRLLHDSCPPLIVFAKDAHYALNELSQSGYDVVSIDWTVKPELARFSTNNDITLQGNMDPCALYASDESIKEMVSEMVKEFGTEKYIANLGHGIYPDIDPEKVAVFVDAVHNCHPSLIRR